MKASIIINNYNYGHFLKEAVESALHQTHPDTEVIVVDDGSNDDSLKVLESYKSRIKVIAKRNGGQGSCYSEGFARCSGEVVLFLDADDYLRADCIERVLRSWSGGVAKVHFYLTAVNVHGTPLGTMIPSGVLAGRDAREMMKLFGSYCSSPGSGNVFSAAFLKEILPFENERELMHDADSVPIFAAPSFGEIVAIGEPLGFYRRHDGADSSVSIHFEANSSLEALRLEHQRDLRRERRCAPFCPELAAAPYRFLSPTQVKRRLCYLRLSGTSGLVRGDTRWNLLVRGIRSIWFWSGYRGIQKLGAAAWFVWVAAMPSFLAQGSIKAALAIGERNRWQKWLLGNRGSQGACS